MTASPKTCGWRRTILFESASTTSATENLPVSVASCEWKTICSSKSPSSSHSRLEVAAFDRFDDFVRFFDEVRYQRAMRLLAIPRAAHSQARHDFDEIVPGVVRGCGGSGTSGMVIDAESVARGMPGTISAAIAARFQRAQQRRQARESRRADCRARRTRDPLRRRCVEALDEALDFFAAAAHEERRIVHHCAHDCTPLRSRYVARSGGASSDDRAADRAQCVEAADRQESRIARAETRRCEPASLRRLRDGAQRGPGSGAAARLP